MRTIQIRSGLAAGILMLFGTSNGLADVLVSTSPNISLIDPPPAYLPTYELESDLEIFGITESVGVSLGAPVSVDAVGTGDFHYDALAPGTIWPGEHVNSFLLHFDPVSPAGISGEVEFAGEVLGVIFMAPTLNASDGILGSPSTVYNNSGARGFEPLSSPSVADDITVGLKTILVNFNATSVFDQVRVITRAIQEVLIDLGPACLNINGHGIIPVAILGSAEFDVTQVDTTTLLFGGLELRLRGNMAPMCSMEDSNGDGNLDLVCHFEDDSEAWLPGTGTATLSGALLSGLAFEGTTDICIVP